MKQYYTFFLIALLAIAATWQIEAQPTSLTLRKHRNLPHAGDSIIKQQVEYVDPGASGRDINWDFRTVHPVDDAYNLVYKALATDTVNLYGIEHYTLYCYKVKGDSLLHTGFENATTLMSYSQPELKMKFPFHYGDTISAPFEGKGEYCQRMPLHVAGRTTLIADGSGTLYTPDGMEYKKVLRVKNLREYTQTAADSITMSLETYSWYVKGNRYPVFETIKTITRKIGKEEMEHKVASFFYPPVQQGQQTDTTGLADVTGRDVACNVSTTADIDQLFTNCRLLPNPVESQLRIEYDLTQNATVNFSLHDAIGVPKITTSPKQQQPSHYTETISMGGFPKGVYPLYVTVNGMVKTLHVVKK